jgi:hypothetical protein
MELEQDTPDDETADMVTSERLSQLLETYGTDRRRWPPGADHGLDQLLATSDTARACWSEAAAFERLLGMARNAEAPASDRLEMLTERIVARALAERPLPDASEADNVIVMPVRGSIEARAAAGARMASRRALPWAVGGLLAASLALGVVLGAFNVTPAPELLASATEQPEQSLSFAAFSLDPDEEAL